MKVCPKLTIRESQMIPTWIVKQRTTAFHLSAPCKARGLRIVSTDLLKYIDDAKVIIFANRSLLGLLRGSSHGRRKDFFQG